MNRLIRLTLAGLLTIGFGIGLGGCTDESTTKTQTTQSTPNGKTVETEQKTVKQSGDNPPPPTKAP